MDRGEFEACSREWVSAGQVELARAMRVLVRKEAPEIAETLEDQGDTPYLEPLVFTYFAEDAPQLGLPQILWGVIPVERRPDAIEVNSDEKGRVYLPRVGYFLSDERNASLILLWDRETDRYTLLAEEQSIPFRFEALQWIPGTSIEVLRYENPLLLTRFFDTQGEPVRVAIDRLADSHIDHLTNALWLIREYRPQYAAELARTMRQIVIFNHPSVNSFASINAHGVAFFNAREEHDESFFVDELLHQCGHVIFNAMTVRRRDFLAMDPDGPLHAIAPKEHDRRNIYDAFHGLYTENVMSEGMRVLEEAQVFSGKRAHELYGRLSFIARKYRVDLRNLSADGVFTELGADVYGFFRNAFEELAAARPDLLSTDLTGQPYNFDYRLFERNNPVRSRALEANPAHAFTSAAK